MDPPFLSAHLLILLGWSQVEDINSRCIHRIPKCYFFICNFCSCHLLPCNLCPVFPLPLESGEEKNRNKNPDRQILFQSSPDVGTADLIFTKPSQSIPRSTFVGNVPLGRKAAFNANLLQALGKSFPVSRPQLPHRSNRGMDEMIAKVPSGP